MSEIWANLATVAAALGGYEGLKYVVNTVMYKKSYLKKEEAEADKAEINNLNDFAAEWKALYEQSEAKKSLLETKVETLILEKEGYLNKILDAGLENQRLLFFRCNRLECTEREPQKFTTD